MNNDQQMVAMLGLALILLVMFGTYRKQLSTILFSTPQQPYSLTGPLKLPSPLGIASGGLLSAPVTPTVTNTTAPTPIQGVISV